MQLSRLLNIKTGGCPEDCGYCSQSSHHSTGLAASKLMDVDTIVAEARKAKAGGATRYCMGAAWRNPKPRDMDAIVEIVSAVKGLGMETCMTLGMLDRLNALSARGFAFNMLTKYSDAERMRSDLYYADPCFLFDYCKKRYARRVSLLHDYPLYEFTMIVRKS